MKLPRRNFLHLAAGAVALPVTSRAATAEQSAGAQTSLEPLVWPVVTTVPPGVRAFAGHANTVPDIVGRFGAPASLVIFTEGNHLMVLHGEDILASFPSWANSQKQYADLALDNIVLLTLPQPIVVQTIRTGALALGNLLLEFSRSSGYYPDIVMAGPAPLRALRGLGVIEPQARVSLRIAVVPFSFVEAILLGLRGLLTWRELAHASRKQMVLRRRPVRAI
jgi:hypothetical protein